MAAASAPTARQGGECEYGLTLQRLLPSLGSRLVTEGVLVGSSICVHMYSYRGCTSVQACFTDLEVVSSTSQKVKDPATLGRKQDWLASSC